MSENKRSAEQVEQERLTRRQALRKFGFGAGLSAIMLLGADDLARMVGKRMAQMEGNNKVADQIAKEFQSAGIALAGSGGGLPPGGSATACQAWEDPANHNSAQCEGCQSQVVTKCEQQGVSATQCNSWAAQCDQFCATANYNDWWNCWNEYSNALP